MLGTDVWSSCSNGLRSTRRWCVHCIEKTWQIEYRALALHIVTSSLKYCVKPLKAVWKDKINRNTFIIYFATFVILLPLLCRNMPNSLFFRKNTDLAFERNLSWTQNDMNAKMAADYITREKKLRNSSHGMAGDNGRVPPFPVVYVTVISIARNPESKHETKYLTQTVAKTHELLKEFRTIHDGFFQMALCNVDASPLENAEASYLSEALGIPIFNRFAQYGVDQTESENIFEKEKNDYWYCLNESLKKKPQYVLLLEDDAVPVDSAFRVIHHALTHSFKYYFSEKRRRNIAYIKLYHPSRILRFFDYQVERIPELLALGVIFGSATLWLWTRLGSRPINRMNIRRLWLHMIVYFILVFLCIGRSNILKVRELSLHFYQIVPAPSCCTPAMLFPNFTAHTLVKYLRHTESKSGYAKDYILETFKKDTGLEGKMISPNLVRHIGMYSSVRKKTLDPYIVN